MKDRGIACVPLILVITMKPGRGDDVGCHDEDDDDPSYVR